MKIRQRTGDRPDSARDRIIATAAELFHNNGYNATGIDQILKAARATKGSFHHHFGSKKQIALDVIKEIVAPKFNRRMIDPVVHAPKPLDAIRRVIRNLRTQGSTDDLLTGCPINNLSSELALQDRQIQSSLSALFDRWQDEWAKALRSQSDLEVQTGFKSARQLALYIVATIEGAQAMAKAQQSREPLDAVLKHLETTLRRSHD
jgi:TetR/AcrR family transcriptional regulator, transcriptional repressor for nem operon